MTRSGAAAPVDRAPAGDRRAARREQAKAEIVAAAWELVRDRGLAGLAMRDLAARVGIRAPTLYSYFASKHDIYDAMFRDASLEFRAEVEQLQTARQGGVAGRELLHRAAHMFFRFATADPVRYQLLFQRTIPDFEPSDESYAVAQEVERELLDAFAHLGITDPSAADLWTAVLTGLTSQQLANEPGGERWARLVDRAVDMLATEIAPHLSDTGGGTRP